VAADLDNCAAHVTIAGNPVAHRDSHFKKSTGNEVSRPTGGGVVSHAVQGKAVFRSYSPNVFIEGKPAVRHADLLTQNHTGQTGNTPPSVWMSSVDLSKPQPPKKLTKVLGDGKDWIEIVVVDEEGESVPHLEFRIAGPKGKSMSGRLLAAGSMRLTGIAEGKCKLSLPGVDGAQAVSNGAAASPSGATVYRPGKALLLDTGQTHQIVVFGLGMIELQATLCRHNLRPAPGVSYRLRLPDGSSRAGKADGKGRLRELIPKATKKVTVSYRLRTDEPEIVREIEIPSEEQDKAQAAHLRNMGFAEPRTAHADPVTSFQLARPGLKAHGAADEATSKAIDAAVKTRAPLDRKRR
jgi:hypothetical protein